MNVWEWLLVGVVLWTGIGVLGVLLALVRGELERMRRGVRWLLGVWVVYLAVVVGVSLVQKQRVLVKGAARCFDEMCFTVTGVEEVPGYFGRNKAGDGTVLLRVSVRVMNEGKKAQSERLLGAYLVDAQGRRWEEAKGLTGVRLVTTVAGGATVESEPVFQVAADAKGVELVLTHGRWQPGVLVVGDSDSLFHKRTVVGLGR